MAYGQKWEVSPFAGYWRLKNSSMGSLNQDQSVALDSDVRVKGDGYSYGVRLTWNTRGYYGQEIAYMRYRMNVRADRIPVLSSDGTSVVYISQEGQANVDTIFYDFLAYFMPAGERWRPYFAGGAQVSRYGIPKIPYWTGGSSRNLGFNYGIGLKLRIAPHTLVRFDLRDYIGGRPYTLTISDPANVSGHLRSLEGSLGLGIAW